MISISDKEVKSLDAKQLTDLLRKLLFLEKRKHDFPDCYINVPRNITAPDGGEDGRLITTNKKDSNWLITNFCVFQCKASPMSSENCKTEMFKKNSQELKQQIKDAIDEEASYILLSSKDTVAEKDIGKREKSIREAIKESKIALGMREDDAITFSSKIKIKVYDSNIIADWVNEHFPAILFVKRCNNMELPLGLLNWEGFESYQENQNTFYSNEDLSSIIKNIRSELFNKKHIRIEGVSGIGKSRLVCQTLSPFLKRDGSSGIDYEEQTLTNSMVYYNLNNSSNELLNFVRSYNQLNMILVIDNCPPNAHNDFLRECQRTGSNITLLTIDYERMSHTFIQDYRIITLKDEYYKSVTLEVLNDKYKGVLSDSDIQYLNNFSEGNTKMAIDFAQASIDALNLNETINDDLIKKLVFGRDNIDETEFRILKMISIFKSFEYPHPEYLDLNKEHYLQLLDGTKFIENYYKLSEEKVTSTIEKFISKGCIERRGNFIMVRPTPLALKLSLLFWKSVAVHKYQEFIENIPNSLRIELTRQLGRVGNVQKAKEIVNSIWGVNGNFSTAEILNSDRGSLLFRSIVNVSPIESCRVLKNHFLDKPIEYLESIEEGRMNLVWALEKLCFRKETFQDSAKILMSFAAAEIETYYSNNSTSYFRQLFKVQLAGTEVPLSERIEIIKWGLTKSDKFIELSLSACASAFNSTGNHRIMGAEHQGSQLPLKDYQPSSLDEVHDYFDTLIDILNQKLESEFDNRVKKIIISSLLYFIDYGYDFNKLRAIFDSLVNDNHLKNDFRKSLIRAKDFNNGPNKTTEIIDEYIISTSPKTIKEKILSIVSNPEYTFAKKHGKELIEVNTEEFAKELTDLSIDLKPYLKILLTGQQSQGFTFGVKYGELNSFDNSLIDESISYLIDLNENTWDLSFLHGYLSRYSNKERLNTFNKFVNKKSKFAFLFYRNVDVHIKDCYSLIELIKEGVEERHLNSTAYEFQKLNPVDFLSLIQKLYEVLLDKSLILKIIYLYIRNETPRSILVDLSIYNFLEEKMEKDNLLTYTMKGRNVSDYEWGTLMIKLLELNHKSSTIVSKQIIDYFQGSNLYTHSNSRITKVALKTLETDFDTSWQEYSELIRLNYSGFLTFKSIFHTSIFNPNKNSTGLFSDDERNIKLLKWFKVNPNAAPRVIRITPLSKSTNEWHPFTLELIKMFGDDENFQNELSCNLHSMTTVGSRVPYLEYRKKLLERLKEDGIGSTNWIEREISYFDKNIKKEKIIDDQDGIR